MPEYLAPGVYVEETSFRSKSIEGVSTSTAGFVGPARTGPISGDPELLVSFADFQRIYGGLDDLTYGGRPRTNYLAHAVRAFFEEGGRRLYVSRVFNFPGAGSFTYQPDVTTGVPAGYASRSNLDAPDVGPDIYNPPVLEALRLLARFPGAAGNLRVTFTLRVGPNALGGTDTAPTLTRVQDLDVVHVRRRNAATDTFWLAQPSGAVADGLFIARRNPVAGSWELRGDQGNPRALTDLFTGLPVGGEVQVRPLTVVVEVERPLARIDNGREFEAPEVLGEFGFHVEATSSLLAAFSRRPPTRFMALTVPFAIVRRAAGVASTGVSAAGNLDKESLNYHLIAVATSEDPDCAVLQRAVGLASHPLAVDEERKL